VILGANDDGARRPSYSPTLLGLRLLAFGSLPFFFESVLRPQPGENRTIDDAVADRCGDKVMPADGSADTPFKAFQRSSRIRSGSSPCHSVARGGAP
jgi:hypothetical protein